MAQSEEWFTPRECSLTYVYTNEQPVHNETRSFIYADDQCIATQRITFERTETILTEALHNLGEYYERNHLRANPDKTQTCAFHLKNREASMKLNIIQYNKHIEHTHNPVYMGLTRYTNKSAKHSLGSYQIQNGEPIQQPSKQQPLHSATLLRYMCIQCGKDQHT